MQTFVFPSWKIIFNYLLTLGKVKWCCCCCFGGVVVVVVVEVVVSKVKYYYSHSW